MKKTLLLALSLSAAPAFALPHSGVGCAPTAEAAIAHLLNGSLDLNANANGFRIDSVHHDKLRDRSWAMVASCAEPARPRVAMLLPKNVGPQSMVSTAMVSTTPIIHPGDRVKVLSRTGDSNMELLGWAEEAGAEKQQIRVRLGLPVDPEHAALTLRCSIVSAGVVEVVR